jgi:hypothetical protein
MRLIPRESTRPLISYLITPSTRRIKRFTYEFYPKQSLRYFLFFRQNPTLTLQHGREHVYYCKHYSCPYHHPQGS